MKRLLIPVVIVIVAVNNNIIEFLSSNNYPSTLIMVARGGLALVLTIILAIILKKRITPQSYRSQIIRVFIEGTSIWLLYESFKYLSAGSVALMQRMDIPFLVIISFLRGKVQSSLQFYISIWSIFILLFFILDAKFIDEEPIGFVYATASVALLTTAYFIIKDQTTKESVFTISTTYALGLVVVGLLTGLAKQDDFSIQTEHFWIFGCLGMLQLGIVLSGVTLFKYYKPERARFPFILGAFATLILEMIIEKKVFSFNQIGLSVLITGIIVTICLDPKAPKIKRNEKTIKEVVPPT